ncbi:MAG TPA: tetratricopeptide repeat protein [Bryobacteraceae bacterium]|nr:tetratricopeptide repeat protein [Bryobacteraceae bacterium]
MLSLLQNALDHHRAGRLNDAERIYLQILAADAEQPDCLHLLGMIEHQRGRHQVAADMIRHAIAIRATEAAYHSNLGGVLQSQGKLDEAAACFEQALFLKPNWAEVHSNFGNVLQALGKLDEAVASQERALALKPDFAQAWSNLGNARQAQGNLDAAAACYQRALAIQPDYADAHNNLGGVLASQERAEEAVPHLERALALKPGFASAHNNLANVYASQDRTEDAMVHYERALALNPDYAHAHNNLANVFKHQGKFEEAAEHYSRAIAIQPDYTEAHYGRAEITSFEAGSADLAALEALSGRDDPYIHFALAKALEDCGDYARAWEYFRRGNALKRAQIDYAEEATVESFKQITAVFDRALFDRFEQQGDPSDVPIFVLGMPRSGSTLVEQILAGHPQIHAAGELTTLEKIIINYPQCVPELDGAALRSLAQSYLGRLPALADGKLRVVDKLSGNFLRIGLIRLMLPNARIIHTRRDPVDTCVSCYSKLFTSGLLFSYDLAELGRYYRHYSELMAHWRSVLPPSAMLEVSYEDVVNDLEGQARRLIDYCGLPWDDRCISFHKTKRPVKTASAVQVRKPLFRSSLQRWRHYEAGLAPLLRELGVHETAQ